MIKEGGFFGVDTLHFYMKGHTKNYFGRAFNRLNVLYRKQHVSTFEKSCEILNTRNTVEVTQMFHENFFDLESLLNYIYEIPDPKTANINHVFQVKKIRHTLFIVGSSMAKESLNIVIIKKILTEGHRRREESETFTNT